MLDIGVGGGRTTYYFANLFKKYIGVDIADNYFEILSKKFPNYKFIMKDILICEFSEKFDFVLFSHNGIDYSKNINDFVKCIGKMNNLSNKYFAFSSHNILYKKLDLNYKEFTENVCNSGENINTIYTNPNFIYNILKSYNFKIIKIYNRKGDEIDINKKYNWNFPENCWLYYFIEK